MNATNPIALQSWGLATRLSPPHLGICSLVCSRESRKQDWLADRLSIPWPAAIECCRRTLSRYKAPNRGFGTTRLAFRLLWWRAFQKFGRGICSMSCMYVRWGQDEAGGLQKPTRRWGNVGSSGRWLDGWMAVQVAVSRKPVSVSVGGFRIKIRAQLPGSALVSVSAGCGWCVCVLCPRVYVVEAGSIRARGRVRRGLTRQGLLRTQRRTTTGGVRDWRSGILARWVGPWGDTCRDFSRYSPGPACLLPGRHGGMAGVAGVAGLSMSEMLKIRRLSPTGYTLTLHYLYHISVVYRPSELMGHRWDGGRLYRRSILGLIG